MLNKQKILKGRKAVDAYRKAHTKLHSKLWHKGVPGEHTPLLDKLLAGLKKQGFNTIQEFFDASRLLNTQELGFTDREDFRARANKADREALRLKWS